MSKSLKIYATIFCILMFSVAVYYLTSTNFAARKLGGTITVKLEPGQKLINATWKETELWYLTEEMSDDYQPKKKIFQEQSLHGIIEGKVVFVETK